MLKISLKKVVICLMFLVGMLAGLTAFSANAASTSATSKPMVKKILFFGDSTTGWLADRLQAYGEKNGFEVSALIWDGATMKKYAANADKLKKYITSIHPDAIFISLGMNEMGAKNPETQLGPSLAKIRSTIGNIPIIWVGPASWPGKNYGPGYENWMKSKLGSDIYYSSLSLDLPRQSKTNPHPTRAGAAKWMDAVVNWLKSGKGAVTLPGYAAPAKNTLRPKTYIYRKMKSPL